MRIVHEPKRKPQSKSKGCKLPREQITKLQNQAATNLSHYSKLQPLNINEPNKGEPLFFLTPTHSIFTLIFRSSTMLI